MYVVKKTTGKETVVGTESSLILILREMDRGLSRGCHLCHDSFALLVPPHDGEAVLDSEVSSPGHHEQLLVPTAKSPQMKGVCCGLLGAGAEACGRLGRLGAGAEACGRLGRLGAGTEACGRLGAGAEACGRLGRLGAGTEACGRLGRLGAGAEGCGRLGRLGAGAEACGWWGAPLFVWQYHHDQIQV